MPQTIEFEGTTHEFPDDFSQPEIQAALNSMHPKSAPVPGMEKLGGSAPPPAAPPMPTGLAGPPVSQNTFRNPRTGMSYDRGKDTGTGPLGILDAPIQGGQQVKQGVEQMAEPGMRSKAGGLSKVIRGTAQAATPLLPAAAIAAPVATAVGLGAGTLAQSGTQAGLQAMGAPEEYSSLAGDVAGGLVGGKAAKSIGRMGVPEAAGNVKDSILPGRDPQRAMVQALKPKSTNLKFSDSLNRSLPELKATEADLGKPIGGIDDLAQAVDLAKKRVWGQYQQMAGPMAKAQVDLSPVADAMVASVPEKLRLENPQAAQALEATANKYRTTFPLQQAEQFLKTTNAELDAYYGKYPAAQRTSRTANPDTAALESQASALRDSIYRTLDQPGEGGAARELKQRYGSLMNIEREVQRRVNVAARQQPDSLSQQVGKWSAAGHVVRGVLTGNPADVAMGAAQAAASKYLKEQQTTDALIRAAFKNFKGSPAPVQMPPAFQPRGLLTPGDIVTPPPADTSYVRGVPGQYGQPPAFARGGIARISPSHPLSRGGVVTQPVEVPLQPPKLSAPTPFGEKLSQALSVKQLPKKRTVMRKKA